MEKDEMIRYMKKQLAAMRLIVILLLVLIIGMAGAAVYGAGKIGPMMEDLQSSVERIDRLTAELEEANLPGVVEHADSGIQKLTEKVEAMDIEKLNDAIEGLYNVVGPLGSLFGGTR